MSQLINYIQKELDKGFSKELIREKLLRAGYTKQEIQESFASLKAAEPLLRRKFPDTIHTDVHVRWSKWVFPLLAIALALFFGYLLFLYIEEKPAVEEVSACEEFSDAQERDTCYLELAAGGEEVCEKIASEAMQASCKQKIWKMNPCIYQMLLGEDYASCASETALETGDTQHCFGLDEKTSSCLYEVASLNNDISFCQKDFTCILQLAIAQKEPEACIIFEDRTELSALCYDNYAERTGDTSICSKGTLICGYSALKTEEEKKAFIEDLLPLLEGTREIKGAGEASEQDETLMAYAEEYHDPLFCSFVSDAFQEECLMNI